MGTHLHGIRFDSVHSLFVSDFFLDFSVKKLKRFDHPVEHGLEVAFDKFWPVEGKKEHHGDK